MIVTFKSAASGDVIMFGDVAKRMMELMGKNVTDQGIVTVEQLPDALARLRAAVAADKANRVDDNDDESNHQSGGGRNAGPAVSLTQRATPLIELLDWSLKKKKPVTWGV
jgi:hypothetical protein